ncbi:21778_t:CDS:2 [Gigaspora margarita]|uniref:21778_t:CDS:1 n=1 Tax=Gigaspora margarita TaxID=4874 RepID=A0ABM8W2Y6_GIGMA|nr:21778_t:CDS:2 [Gigaspora margarita]
MAKNECECSQLRKYLSTMNKGLEEVRGRDGPLLRRLPQIILDGKKDSVQSEGGPESSSK